MTVIKMKILFKATVRARFNLADSRNCPASVTRDFEMVLKKSLCGIETFGRLGSFTLHSLNLSTVSFRNSQIP